MSYEFDLSTFPDIGQAADEEYKISSPSFKPLQFIPAEDLYLKRRSTSLKPQYLDNISILSTEPTTITHISTKSPPRSLSQFKSAIDIVSFGAAPLRIKDIPIHDVHSQSLEYLQCALPDLHSIYHDILWPQITKSHKNVKCANYRATKKQIATVMKCGGCKVLQFMAHCCNPQEVQANEAIASHPYTSLITAQMLHNNADYVLLECDKNISDGEWIHVDELQTLFNAEYNDILIILSPQHHKMVDIFAHLGYKYIVGIQTFNENIAKQQRDHNNWKLKMFLTHFYSALLDGECIERSFELAQTASNTHSQQITLDIMKKLMTTESEKDALKRSEFDLKRVQSIGNQDSFRLYIQHEAHERFVAFHDYQANQPIEVGAESMLHLQLCHPFMGRSTQVIELYEAVQRYPIVSCVGHNDYGRRSVIIKLMNYVQQHLYFEHGVVIIDCEQERKRSTEWMTFEEMMDHMLAQQLISMRMRLSQINYHNIMPQQSTSLSPLKESEEIVRLNESYKSIPSVLDDIVDEFPTVSMCVVLLNIDEYRNNEPHKWMAQYFHKMPGKSRCIYTEDMDKSMKYAKDKASTRNIFDAGTFATVHLDKLPKRTISELFMNVISTNRMTRFTVEDIEQHDGIQSKLDGKPRFVKKAAAFVSQLQTTEHKVLSLDVICERLPTEWIPKKLSFRVVDSLLHPSTKLSHMSSSFIHHPSRLAIGRSQFINEDEDTDEDMISQIQNATDPSQLLSLIKHKHLNDLKRILLKEYDSSNAHNVYHYKDGQESPLKIDITSYWSQTSFRSSTNSLGLTPPEHRLRSNISFSCHSEINDSPISTNYKHKKKEKASKKGKKLKKKKSKNKKRNKHKCKPALKQSIQFKNSPIMSESPIINEIEMFTHCDAKIESVYNSRILSRLDQELQNIWYKECCNHNQSIALLCNLQIHFNVKFCFITKYKLKRKIPKIESLECYYLNAFEIIPCKEINDKLALHVSQLETFWQWLEGASYLIFKLKTLYLDNNQPYNHEWGLLIGKERATSILLETQNVENGTFILYVDAHTPFQLNLLYHCHKNDAYLKEIVIKYNKNTDCYHIHNEENKDMQIVEQLSDYIQYKSALKLFYCTKSRNLVEKSKIFLS